MRTPLVFIWQLRQEAEARGQTLEEYCDNVLRDAAAKANMSIEEFTKSLGENTESEEEERDDG